jgi:predicted ester cyclase
MSIRVLENGGAMQNLDTNDHDTGRESAREVVLRLVDEVVNGGRLDLVEELVHPDFFDHGAIAARSCGPTGFRATVTALRDAFAGYRVEPRDLIVADGKVVVRATASGRRVGDAKDMPRAGDWSHQQIHIFRLADDKVIEHWASHDELVRPHIK